MVLLKLKRTKVWKSALLNTRKGNRPSEHTQLEKILLFQQKTKYTKKANVTNIWFFLGDSEHQWEMACDQSSHRK